MDANWSGWWSLRLPSHGFSAESTNKTEGRCCNGSNFRARAQHVRETARWRGIDWSTLIAAAAALCLVALWGDSEAPGVPNFSVLPASIR